MIQIKYPIGGYAPGHYFCKCHNCGENFMGDKLSQACEPCAINTMVESYGKISLELRHLKIAIKTIHKANLTIDTIIKK
jgi:hypothetical protein